MFSKSKVKIEWKKSDKMLCYIIEKRNSDNDNYQELVRIYNEDMTNIIVGEIEINKETIFRIRTISDNGNNISIEYVYVYANERRAVAFQYPKPKLVKAYYDGNDNIFEWKGNSDKTMYHILRRLPGQKWESIANTYNTYYRDTSVTGYKKYFYTVYVTDCNENRLSSFAPIGIICINKAGEKFNDFI